MTCTYQEQPHGKNCDFPLLKEKTCYSALQEKGIANCQNSQVHKNELLKIRNPICVYYKKSITRWLQWFLGQQKIENEIENWAKIVTNLPYFQDIQQALAWKHMVWPVLSDEAPLKLVFSLFIDWFNPRGNKQAGKQESLGVILLKCLNLPPAMQNKPAYTLVHGIIPGPNTPNVTNISNILKPLVNELLWLKDGIEIET
ncbi:hypothetical protein O181_120055 [Austropuccinia psidii MF-1]|uniref:Uncharacterized protein n=1 Tax=Austropuccinia psidii MF-1 TaxID=1389203 RepID=A0A9Q3Q0Y9_9BASI|nr:hypothetical protein [Austropuccinia psidii MF-1]